MHQIRFETGRVEGRTREGRGRGPGGRGEGGKVNGEEERRDGKGREGKNGHRPLTIFGLKVALRLRPNIRDRRQTDRRQTALLHA